MRQWPGLLALTVALAACAPTPNPTAGAPSPVIATASDGRYTLALALPKETWQAGEPITGSATLSLEPGPDAMLSGSGGPIGFTFQAADGTRRVDPAFTADCAFHALGADAPMVKALAKSGGWSDDMPDPDFYRAFFAGPDVKLPPGDWDIGAVLALNEGPDCRGRSLGLAPTVRIRVTP